MKQLAIALSGLLLITACHENANQQDEYVNGELVQNDVPANDRSIAPPVPEASEVTMQKLIKTGQLTFEVSNLSSTHKFLLSELQKHNGYVALDEQNQGYNRVTNDLVLRIPASSFDAYLEAISKEVSHFDEKTIEVRDVTERFVDLEARLRSKRALEARYMDLLGKANAVEDILRVERELNTVRTEIESMEGRMRVLANQIQFSTLTIHFYTTEETIQAQGFGSKLGHEFMEGWEGLGQFFLAAVRIWPFLIIFAIIAMTIKWRWKKARSRS